MSLHLCISYIIIDILVSESNVSTNTQLNRRQVAQILFKSPSIVKIIGLRIVKMTSGCGL